MDRTIHIGALILLLCCSTAVHAVQPETGGSEARTEPEVPDAVAVSEDVADSIAMVEGDVREIEEHPQDAPADVGFLIVTADGRSRLRIRGSIRVNGGYDINGLLGSNTFTPIDIPVGREQDGETAFFMRANQSRLGIDISQQTPIGEGFGRLELDFLGSGATARVRHAFGGMGPVLVGQTWSTFSDVNSLPLTVDLDGPSSSVAERTVQIRYTREIDESFVMAVGVESPKLEVDEPDTLTLRPAFQTFPDVAAWTRHRAGWGHLQISGVLRSISVRNAAGNLDVLAGYGGLFSGRVGLAGEDALLFQAVLGSGISKFITAFAGRNLDVIFNPISGEFETLGVGGGYASYDRVWTETLHSYFTAGLISIFNKIYEEDSAFNHAEYVSANLFWDPGHGGRVGLEYTFGRRVNKDQQDGIANRIAFIFYYDF